MPTTFSELIPKVLEDNFPQKLTFKLEAIYKEISDGNLKMMYESDEKNKKISSVNLQVWKSFSNDLKKTTFQRSVLTYYEYLLSIFNSRKLLHADYVFSDKEITKLYWVLLTFQKLIISYSTFQIVDDLKEYNNLVIKKLIFKPLLASFRVNFKSKNLLKTLIFEQNLVTNIINLKIYTNLNSQMLLEIIDNLLLLLETLIFLLLQIKPNKNIQNNLLELTLSKTHLYHKIFSKRRSTIPNSFIKKLQVIVRPVPEHRKILKLRIQCCLKILKRLKWKEIFKIINKDELFLIKLRKRRQYILSDLIILQERNILAYFRLIDTHGCF